MEHEFQIELKEMEGAVLRVLGMIERRGFRLQSCFVEKPEFDRQQMRATVSSARPISVLQRQLERIHDVVSVQLRGPADKVGVQALEQTQTRCN